MGVRNRPVPGRHSATFAPSWASQEFGDHGDHVSFHRAKVLGDHVILSLLHKQQPSGYNMVGMMVWAVMSSDSNNWLSATIIQKCNQVIQGIYPDRSGTHHGYSWSQQVNWSKGETCHLRGPNIITSNCHRSCRTTPKCSLNFSTSIFFISITQPWRPQNCSGLYVYIYTWVYVHLFIPIDLG